MKGWRLNTYRRLSDLRATPLPMCYVDGVVKWASLEQATQIRSRSFGRSGLVSILLSILQSDPTVSGGIDGRYGQVVGTAKLFGLRQVQANKGTRE
jgi:hypothetical protein